MDTKNLHFNTKLLIQEMVRRGILCEQIGESGIIKAKFGNHTELVDGTTTSLMPSNYQCVFDDKWKTKNLLLEHKFSVAAGKVFEGSNLTGALDFAETLSFPLVIKPNIGTHGYQVRMNIDTIEELEEVFYNLSREIGYRDILIEEQVVGQEYRLTVTQNGFFAAIHRSFPCVIGDGKSTIEELVTKINIERATARVNCLCRIWLDNESKRFLEKQGKSFATIPEKDALVFVRSNSNVSTGGGCIDVTDRVHPAYREIAFHILESFPGLPYIGIDLITEDIENPGAHIICELNPDPGLSLHTHPGFGTPRDLPKVIINLLFPETTQPQNKANLKELYESTYPEDFFYKPLGIEIELSTLCNLRCPDCAILEDVKNPTTLDTQKIISSLNSVPGIYGYSITGGEPFLQIDSIVEILKNTPGKDLFKIQTNGSLFKTQNETLNLLSQLEQAGFSHGENNLIPSIALSFGMQTDSGVPLANLCHFIYGMQVVFGDRAICRLNLTMGEDHTEEKYIEEIKDLYFSLYQSSFETSTAEIKFMPLYNYFDDSIAENAQKKISIEKVLDMYGDWGCFGRNGDEFGYDSPLPRMLLRSTGDIYSCIGFSNVFFLGNLMQESLSQIIENANSIEPIRIIKETGIRGFYAYIQKRNPIVRLKKFPLSEAGCSICTVCRYLVGEYKKIQS